MPCTLSRDLEVRDTWMWTPVSLNMRLKERDSTTCVSFITAEMAGLDPSRKGMREG